MTKTEEMLLNYANIRRRLRNVSDTKYMVDARDEPTIGKLFVADIIKAVSRCSGLSYVAIVGERRSSDLMFPRHVGMYLAKELTLFSLPHIGRAFGNRDHTTILNGVRRVERRIGEGHFPTIDLISRVKRELTGAAE